MIITDTSIIIETKEDIQKLFKKYDCKTLKELDYSLWLNFGIVLINPKSIKL